MRFQMRDLALVASLGIGLGLTVAVLDQTVFHSADGEGYSGADRTAADQTSLEADFNAKLQELRGLQGETNNSSGQWAARASESDHSDLGQSDYVGIPLRGVVTPQPDDSLRPSGLDYPSASRAWLERQEQMPSRQQGPASADLYGGSSPNIGAINVRSGQYYAPAGTGYVNPQDGTYYAPSGPNGVVDTRTGSFIPVAP